MKRVPIKRGNKLLKKSNKPIPKQSKRRKKIDAEYYKKVKAWKEKNPACQVCKIRATTDCHHIRGRGRFLLVESTWLATCSLCHKNIEENRGWARRMGYLVYGVEGK